jgi:hypothetical protein
MMKWQQALLRVLPNSYVLKFSQTFSDYYGDYESAFSEAFKEAAAPHEATSDAASRGLEQLGASDAAIFALRASDSQIQLGPSGDIILYCYSNSTLGITQNVMITAWYCKSCVSVFLSRWIDWKRAIHCA